MLDDGGFDCGGGHHSGGPGHIHQGAHDPGLEAAAQVEGLEEVEGPLSLIFVFFGCQLFGLVVEAVAFNFIQGMFAPWRLYLIVAAFAVAALYYGVVVWHLRGRRNAVRYGFAWLSLLAIVIVASVGGFAQNTHQMHWYGYIAGYCLVLGALCGPLVTLSLVLVTRRDDDRLLVAKQTPKAD